MRAIIHEPIFVLEHLKEVSLTPVTDFDTLEHRNSAEIKFTQFKRVAALCSSTNEA